MKKSLIIGVLIVVIGVSTFFTHQEVMKIVDIRANEIYLETMAQAVKSLPKKAAQIIENTPEEKKFLRSLVEQEFKYETYTEKTLSGKLMVMHEDRFAADGRPLVEEGKNMHELYLVTTTDIYKVENISYPVFEEFNGIEVSLSGLLSDTKDGKGFKRIIVNIPEEKIRELKTISAPVKNWKSTKNDRGGSACDGNYCALIFPVVIGVTPTTLPTPQQMHDYVFTNPGKIKSNFLEQSYGQMIYGGQMVDSWIPISSIADIATPGLNLPSFVQEYILDNNIDLNDYDQIVFLVHGDNNYTSYSTVGPFDFISNGQTYPIARTVIKMGYFLYPPSVLAANGNLTWWERSWIHETGHALGAYHDNFLACENGSTSLPTECLEQEYGNHYSSMGSGTLGSHFSFYNKYRIGWIDESDIVFRQKGRLTLNPLELQNPSFVKTFSTSFGDFYSRYGYVFEFRRPVGFDSIGKRGDLSLDGVFVYRNTMSGYPRLTDVTPAASLSDSGTWTDVSQKDAVLKNLQSLFDIGTGSSFTGIYGTNTSPYPLTSNSSVTGGVNINPNNPSCITSPLKVFDYTYPETNPAINVAQGQLPPLSWSQSSFTPDLSQMATFSIDNTDQNSELSFNLKYDSYNNDSLSCAATNIQGAIYLDGQPIQSILFSQTPWYWFPKNHNITISTYGLSYGQHILTFVLNKTNDGSSVSHDVVFEVVPI